MTICPPILKYKARVGIIPPASSIDSKKILAAREILENWGLEVVLSENIESRYFQFAGNDVERITAFQQMLDDPSLACILCARGGYGTSRIIDNLDLSGLSEAPKWILGYSDITVLLNQLYNIGIAGIHGPMPLNFNDPDAVGSLTRLRTFLLEGILADTELPGHPLNKPGKASGKLTGGNLSMFVNTIGTPSEVDTNGAILILEDIEEPLYKIDRMMVQLKRAGKLTKLAGLVAGHFTSVRESDRPFGKTVEEIVHEHVSPYGFPLCFNAPIGHEMPNYPFPTGLVYQLDVEKSRTILTLEQQARDQA